VNRALLEHVLKSIVTGAELAAPFAKLPSAIGSVALTIGLQAAPATCTNEIDEMATLVAGACESVTFTVQSLALSSPVLEEMVAVSSGLPGNDVFVRLNVAGVETPPTEALTRKLPAVEPEVSTGDVAIPLASVTADAVAWPAKVAIDCDAVAENCTGTPSKGIPFADVTFA